MKYTLLVLTSIFFLACQQNVKQEAPVTTTTDVKEQSQAPQALKAEMPEQAAIQKLLADRAEGMNAEFPYDVTLRDVEGKEVNSKEILNNGKPTVIMFWLTTCAPCKQKFKAVSRKYPEWKKEADFNLVAISTDWPKNAPKFYEMVKEKNWPWPVYHDFNMDFRKIMPGNLNGLPQEFLFDKDGKLVYHKKKYYPGYEDILFEQIKKIAG